tara:strand:+ start:1072 stop:1593 length:522 start_codon:yes stop_codon:yes gene_type:complete
MIENEKQNPNLIQASDDEDNHNFHPCEHEMTVQDTYLSGNNNEYVSITLMCDLCYCETEVESHVYDARKICERCDDNSENCECVLCEVHDDHWIDDVDEGCSECNCDECEQFVCICTKKHTLKAHIQLDEGHEFVLDSLAWFVGTDGIEIHYESREIHPDAHIDSDETINKVE